jgi:sugar phosphate isomerase/epimerase
VFNLDSSAIGNHYLYDMKDLQSSQHLASASLSRRTFLRTGAAAAVASTVIPTRVISAAPNVRRFADVKIGAISYSYREIPSSAEEILGYLVRGGLNTVELMGSTAEVYAGLPAGPTPPGRWTDLTDAQRAEFRKAQQAHDEEASAWRRSAPMDKFTELGRMYADVGVSVDILKLGVPQWSDAEIDYAYNAARAIGARGISFEASEDAAERMARFASKHKLYNGMHNHTQVGDADWSFDRILKGSPYNALNLDIGHYVAGTGDSPIPVIQKYHDRITHLHLKDRRTRENGGEQMVWGEGDTPIGEVLRLLQREGYPITAMIELEYAVPETSDVLTEMARCIGFCRGALS